MNGITRDLPREDAIGIAEMLVTLGRAVPPSRWVDGIAQNIESASIEQLF